MTHSFKAGVLEQGNILGLVHTYTVVFQNIPFSLHFDLSSIHKRSLR